MRSEGSIQSSEEHSDVVGVIAREGSGDDVSVHHDAVNIALVQAQLVEYLSASTEHEGRAEGDDWSESGGAHDVPGEKHEMDQKREATP